MDALTFSQPSQSQKPQPVYVLAGDEHFLKRLALERIQTLVFAEKSKDSAPSVYEGPISDWGSVRDELETLPFLSSARLVVVQEADTFVSKYREPIEKYLERPSRVGVLVLEVKSWKSNTRLAKAIPEKATLKCEAPSAHRLAPWCVQQAESSYGKRLPAAAASLLVELAGSDMGILDQELAKLATYVGEKPQIESDDIDTLVGHSRTETAWQMLDAVADGNRAKALTTLHHLFDQGEEPMAVWGAMSWQLRRLAQITRLKQQGMPSSAAMSRAGVPPFAQQRMEQQLRQLGQRADRLYDWLLEADLGVKSSGGLSHRTVLERLLIRLASDTESKR